MWRELIAAIDADAQFHAPVREDRISLVESALNVTLPPELTELLQETDGVEVAFGVSMVWSADHIAGNNATLRSESRIGGDLSHCMPVDQLLFFGEAGNGDLFAFPITPEGVRNRVFVWDHEDDSRTCQATSLLNWLRRTSQSMPH